MLTLGLVRRIQELGQRYSETLDDLEAELAKLHDRVDSHLAEMGVK